MASSCGYYRCQIEHRAAHEFAVHLATQRRARETSTTPSSAARSARCARAGASLRTSTADPRGVAPIRDPLAIRDTPVAYTGGETTPSPHHATRGDARPSLLFSPPGHGLSTLDARWKLLIGQDTSGIIRGGIQSVYHHERNHQGKGNVLFFLPVSQDPERQGPMQCRERLGGLLKYYAREAA